MHRPSITTPTRGDNLKSAIGDVVLRIIRRTHQPFLFSALVLLQNVPVAHAADAAKYVLVQVRLQKILDEFHPYPCPTDSNGLECVPIGGYWKSKLHVVSVYAGALEQKDFTPFIGFSSYPDLRSPNGRFSRLYVLGRLDAPDDMWIIDWDTTDHGFCLLSDKKAIRYGFQTTVVGLKRKHPYKPD